MWDVNTGTYLDQATAHRWSVFSFALNRDGRTLISTGGANSDVRVWSCASTCFELANSTMTAQLLFSPTAGHKRETLGIEFDPTSTYLLSHAKDPKAILWDASSGKEQASRNHKSSISGVSFFPQLDGIRTVLWGVTHNTGLLSFGALLERLMPTFPVRPSPLTGIAYNPSNYTMALIEGKDITLWSVYPKPLNQLEATMKHTSNVVKMVWSPDGQYLAVSLASKAVQIWKVDFVQNRTNPPAFTITPKALVQPPTPTSLVTSFSWHPYQPWLAMTVGEKRVNLWDAVRGKMVGVIQHLASNATSAAFHPGGKFLLVGTEQGLLRLFTVYDAQGKLAPSFLRNLVSSTGKHTKAVTNIVWGRAGDLFATTGQDQQLLLWHCIP